MADDKQTENAKKLVAEGKELRAKQDEQRAAVSKGKPTPTQEENDLAMVGGHPELEPDGSGPDPNTLGKTAEAGQKGSYQTRQATPAHSPAAHKRSE
jgi:hypothetical protein